MTTVSIIMATRNAEEFLPDALASISRSIRSTAAVEILVADGNSSDGTLAIATAHAGLKVVSRRDTGIYDGMNQAIAAATGDYCLILNSDDLLLDEALGQAIGILEARPDTGFASAPALFGSGLNDALLRSHPAPLTAEGALFGVPAINARLFRRNVLQGAGPIRTDIGLAADREFMARFARTGVTGVSVETPLYLYRVHQGSHTISGDRAGRQRVYEAEAQLARFLTTDADPRIRQLASAAGAVAALKMRVSRSRPPAIAKGQKQQQGAPMGPIDLWRGLILARKWRGRLSGY